VPQGSLKTDGTVYRLTRRKGLRVELNTHSLLRWLGRRVFPDREIIVRTGDRVGYVRLPRWFQLGCLAVAAAALGWLALATHLNINQLDIIARRDARIVAAEATTHDLARALADAEKRIVQADRRTEIGRERTETLAARNRELATMIDALRKEVAQRDATLVQGDEREKALMNDAAVLRQHIAALETARSRGASTLAELRGEIDRREREKQQLATRIDQLEPEVDALAAARDEEAGNVEALRAQLSQRTDERDRIAGERDVIADRFASLSDQLATLETAQEQIISRFDSQTVESIALVEKTLSLTGVDVERLLGRVEPPLREPDATGIGGPFIAAIADAAGGVTAQLAGDIAAVEERVVRWRGLQALLARLPLAVPLDNFHVESTYGRRIDPLSKRPAMHEGIDFSSDRRAEVRTTAPGRVSFVGWRGGYGKMIEIDHGLGVRTRYAHLSKMYVKRGQEVDFRDKLGQIGNTGRSTGEHLHYEVLLDGRALDPANFMKAGQYVFKN
jgi:murein DD-endopeptidase MepM/ murein hydrolase activator NlpD